LASRSAVAPCDRQHGAASRRKFAAAEKPSVIFLLADDSGFADFSCYGHSYARTPNIDRLAAEGTRFTQFYSTGVTCCPARTGFMTSRRPASFAHYPADGGFGDRVTVTELLHKAAGARAGGPHRSALGSSAGPTGSPRLQL